MATSFSPANLGRSIVSPQQNPSKTPVSFRGACSRCTVMVTIFNCENDFVLTNSAESFHEVSNCIKYSRELSWSSAASYVTLKLGAPCRFSSRLIVLTRSLRRTGIVRATTIEEIEAEKASIEKDVVEYYGTPVSLKSIAQISTPDASSLLVQPYDKSSLKAIEKAIVSSDVGMTPNNDGEVKRLSIPPLTAERRKELSKIVAKQTEEGKVALRNIRRDALKAYEKLEKEKKLSEDNVKDLTSDLQKLTDECTKKVDSVYKQKEKELLTV